MAISSLRRHIRSSLFFTTLHVGLDGFNSRLIKMGRNGSYTINPRVNEDNGPSVGIKKLFAFSGCSNFRSSLKISVDVWVHRGMYSCYGFSWNGIKHNS